jgi:acyl dehydratase
VGRCAEPFVRSWTETDALIYALGVGAGSADPLAELEFTTENTAGAVHRVLPSFAIPLMQTGLGRRLPFGEYRRGALVHAEQELTVHRPLPSEGSMRITARISGIYDKGSGALVRMETSGLDPVTEQTLVTTRLGYFVRGEGGFGGSSAEREKWEVPNAEPDLIIVSPTRPDQALLYRLSGDRNPLHSDPAFAAAARFGRPILHGLCTYGVVARVLLRACCGGDPARFRSIFARFTKPVYPGDSLTTSLWTRGDAVLFQTTNGNGEVVLDWGTLTKNEPKASTTGVKHEPLRRSTRSDRG